MYKLIASDLDGTLLNDLGIISEKNKAAIKKATDKGVLFCLCSGRSFISLEQFERELGLDKKGNFGVAFNGSIVYEADTRKVLKDERLGNKIALEIADHLNSFHADVLVYDGEMLYVEKETDVLKFYGDKSNVDLTLINSFHSIEGNISKILIRGENKRLLKIKKFMEPIVANKCNMFLTDSSLLEFCALDANKGSGILFLANHLGIKAEEIIAVGDHLNDLDMLEAAGLGLAVNNAQKETKNTAKHVLNSTNNESAIHEIVERFL